MKVSKRFIRLGTGIDELNSRDIPANYTPSAYTPSQVSSEGTDKVSAHLKGINNAIASISPISGDINLTSATALDNTTSPTDISGLVFSGSVRSFKCIMSSVRGSTYEVFEILGIKKSSSWEINISSVGDDTGLTISITAGGQLQYTTTNTGSDASLRFRAWVTND